MLAGTSLFGGGTGLARVSIDAHRGVVDYAVGTDEAGLEPRIQARVQDAAALGHPPGAGCVVTLLAWRSASMDDARWARLKAAHETEIELIRAELERESERSAGTPGSSEANR